MENVEKTLLKEYLPQSELVFKETVFARLKQC